MNFLTPDLLPLINQIKEFNQNQLQTNQLLTVQNQLLTQILTELQNNQKPK